MMKGWLTKNFVVVLYAVLSLIITLYHEAWRDEAQAWLIARDCPNLLSMFKLMGYEGTPALWHLILFPFAKLGFPFVTMKFIHYLLNLLVAILIIKKSPFEIEQKVLLVFGYYIFYEYNVIARSYILTVLFLFLIAWCHKKRFEKPYLYIALLFCLANSTLYGSIFFGVIAGLYLFESITEKRLSSLKVAVFTLFSTLISISVILQVLPPPDLSPELRTWNFSQSFIYCFQQMGRYLNFAFIPIQPLRVSFWNCLACRGAWWLGVIIYFASLWAIFVSKKKIALIYLVITSGFLSILIFKYPGWCRHCGLIFMAFIFCAWLLKDYGVVVNKQKALSTLLNVLLLINIVPSGLAFYYDLVCDFSSGEKVAKYLAESYETKKDTLLMFYPSNYALSVYANLPKNTKSYLIDFKRFGTYVVWNQTYNENMHLSLYQVDAIIKDAVNKGRYGKVFLISNIRITNKGFLDRYKIVKHIGEKVIAYEESFYIYQRK